MRKSNVLFAFLAISLVFAGIIFADAASDFSTYRNNGLEMVGADKATSYQVGANESLVIFVNAANQDGDNNATFDFFQNCRAISCDVAGIIKFGVRKSDGTESVTIMQMNAGVMYPIRNVMRIYRYYVGTTACTAQSYNEVGTLNVGIHLWR